ncbi:MAG: hypothetical protein EXQ87_00485 [Alphaproteobacteria bacterium]|nr:hypothetical protein [Alphaproteobacteria bacterium]
MLFTVWPGYAALNPFAVALAALLADALFGDLRRRAEWLPRPRRWLQRLAVVFRDRLNRPNRSSADLAGRGRLVLLGLVSFAALMGVGLGWLAVMLPGGALLEVVMVAAFLRQRGLFGQLRGVARGMTTRASSKGDSHTLARQAVEAAADGYASRVILPVLLYLLIGMPGLWAGAALGALVQAGQPGEAFTNLARLLHGVLVAVPARIAALLLAAGALFTPGGRPGAASRSLLRHGNSGETAPRAALAGALDMALGDPRADGGTPAWLGDGRARLVVSDLRRTAFLFAVACLVHAAFVALGGAIWIAAQ